MSTPSSERKDALPTRTLDPSTVHLTPPPVTLSNPACSGTAMSFDAAYATTASPSGCSESVSAAATMDTNLAASMDVLTSTTSGRPTVHVPVLSRMTVSILAADSRAAAVL